MLSIVLVLSVVEIEAVFVGEAGVGRSDHALACVEPVEHLDRFGIAAPQPHLALDRAGAVRSEEHTSELQSLMRISYPVFCFKKKHNITTIQLLHKPLKPP